MDEIRMIVVTERQHALRKEAAEDRRLHDGIAALGHAAGGEPSHLAARDGPAAGRLPAAPGPRPRAAGSGCCVSAEAAR